MSAEEKPSLRELLTRAINSGQSLYHVAFLKKMLEESAPEDPTTLRWSFPTMPHQFSLMNILHRAVRYDMDAVWVTLGEHDELFIYAPLAALLDKTDRANALEVPGVRGWRWEPEHQKVYPRGTIIAPQPGDDSPYWCRALYPKQAYAAVLRAREKHGFVVKVQDVVPGPYGPDNP